MLESYFDHHVGAEAGQVLAAAEGEPEAVLGGVVADAHRLLAAGAVLQGDLLESVRLNAHRVREVEVGVIPVRGRFEVRLEIFNNVQQTHLNITEGKSSSNQINNRAGILLTICTHSLRIRSTVTATSLTTSNVRLMVLLRP